MQTEAQRRWYANLSPERRAARRIKQRIANLSPDQIVRRRASYVASNRQRIFIGGLYVGRENQFPYPRTVVEQYLQRRLDDFKRKQRREAKAFHEGLAK